MKHLKLIIGIACLPLLVFLAAVYVWPGYYVLGVSRNGSDIAEDIIRREKGAETCKRILDFDPFPSPSAEEQTSLCIHEYAKLTKDPSACELLLPGEYGWDCLGTVASLLNTGSGCSSYASGEILCASGVKGRSVGVDDCKLYHGKDLQFWCYIERTRTLEGVNDCQKISDEYPLVKDECSRWYAYKKKDPSLCSLVRDDKLRKICELKIKYAR